MTGRRPGRPPAEAAPLDDRAIAEAGLALLDEGGEAAVTLRGVARHLGVTPMAVTHRTGGRDGLLGRVVAAAQEGYSPPSGEAAGAAGVAAAVLAYAEAARRHPSAMVVIAAHPHLMPEPLAAFSDWLRGQIARHDPDLAERGLALLVDYVHGHLLATATAPGDAAMEAAFRANVGQLARWILGE